MKKNISNTESIIRIIIAFILGGLFFNGTITGTLGLIAGFLSILLLITGFLQYCPLYSLLFNRPEQKIKN